MRKWVTRRSLPALIAGAAVAAVAPAVSASGLPPINPSHAALASVTRGPTTTAGAVTRTFSYIAGPGAKTATVINIDSLLVNARCSTSGSPVIFAFTSSTDADIFGQIFDGAGRLHKIHQSAFTKSGKGVQLSVSSNDFDANGTLGFENLSRQVVTIDLTFDNSTTLNHHRYCTVYGSYSAT